MRGGSEGKEEGGSKRTVGPSGCLGCWELGEGCRSWRDSASMEQGGTVAQGPQRTMTQTGREAVFPRYGVVPGPDLYCLSEWEGNLIHIWETCSMGIGAQADA